MKRFFQTVLYVICSAIALVIAFIIISNKHLPHGKVGPEAEALTDSMMAAVNCQEWNRLRYVAWSYQGKRDYVWDKLYNIVEVKYQNVRVLLNLNAVDGIVWKNGVRLSLKDKHKYIEKTWDFWRNDSFWFNPICKLRDPGVVRRLVILEDSTRALLATYTQGGVSPGDSFLWIPDDDYIPHSWQMWVRMLPVRGLKSTWEQWTSLGEAQVSTRHHIGPYSIVIEHLRSGSHHSELGLEKDPFVDFVTE